MDTDMKLTTQELERRGKACDGYDNKAKPDLTTSRNQGKGKSKRPCCGCWGYWFAKHIFSEHYVLAKSKQRLMKNIYSVWQAKGNDFIQRGL